MTDFEQALLRRIVNDPNNNYIKLADYAEEDGGNAFKMQRLEAIADIVYGQKLLRMFEEEFKDEVTIKHSDHFEKRHYSYKFRKDPFY